MWHFGKAARPFPYPLLLAIAVAVFAASLYLPALDASFVDWDDDVYLYANSNMGDLSFEFIKYAFTSVVHSNYHPLTMLSYSLDHTIWGLQPRGYHLTNVLLHSLNTFLVVMLAFRIMSMLKKPDDGPAWPLVAACLTGLMFGAHPIHVESVAWVSERKDVLYALFYLLGLLYYLRRGLSSPASQFILASLLALSLLSKPMAITFPLILLVLDYFPLRRIAPQGWARTALALTKEKALLIFLCICSAFATMYSQGHAIKTLDSVYWYERLVSAARALWFYLVKFAYPSGLAPFYRIRIPLDLGPADAAGLVFLIALTLYCLRRAWKQRHWLAAWTVYVITLLPVLGLIQVGKQGAADRYTYLALLGPMMLLSAGAVELMRYLGRLPGRKAKPAMIIAALLAVIALTAMSMAASSQIGHWKNSKALWARELAVFPMEPIAYTHMGHAYYLENDIRMAIKYAGLAIQINPRDPRSYLVRGIAYFSKGSRAQALRDFRKALELAPGSHEAAYYISLLEGSSTGAH